MIAIPPTTLMPMTAEPPPGEGEVLDSASAQPFLALLAAAVAAGAVAAEPQTAPRPEILAEAPEGDATTDTTQGLVVEEEGEAGTGRTNPGVGRSGDSHRGQPDLVGVARARSVASPNSRLLRELSPVGDTAEDGVAEAGDGSGEEIPPSVEVTIHAAGEPSVLVLAEAVSAQGRAVTPARPMSTTDASRGADVAPRPMALDAMAGAESTNPMRSVAGALAAAVMAALPALGDSARTPPPMAKSPIEGIPQPPLVPGAMDEGLETTIQPPRGREAALPNTGREETGAGVVGQSASAGTGDAAADTPGERQSTAGDRSGSSDNAVAAFRAPWVAAAPPTTREAAGPTSQTLTGSTAEPPTPTPSLTSQVTVELDPNTAGAQRVRVAVRGDVVHATVVADANAVDALRPQLAELRQALEGHGFREANVQLRVTGEAPLVTASLAGAAEGRTRIETPLAQDAGAGDAHRRGRQPDRDHQSPRDRGHPEYEEEGP